MVKTLNKEKYPWCIEVSFDLFVRINVEINKLVRNTSEESFSKPGGTYYIEREIEGENKVFIDLSKSLYLLEDSHPHKAQIISTTLDEGLEAMNIQIIRIKNYLMKCVADVKTILPQIMSKGYVSEKEWNGYDERVKGVFNYFGEFRKSGEYLRYFCFAPDILNEYLERGFDEWLKVVDKNVENCVAKARESEKKLESGEIKEGYGSVCCYSGIFMFTNDDNVTKEYHGSGIKPSFVPQKCDPINEK